MPTSKKMVSFYKISKNELNDLPIKEGQLIVTQDDQKIYLDQSNLSRIELQSYSLKQDTSNNYILTFTYPNGTTETINIPGVRSISTGNTNGTISVDTNGTSAEVAVKGLKSAAYADKGAANGVAELDANGKVPSAQLPSYVDDTIEGYYYNSKFYEDSSYTTEIPGETGKIYVDLTSNKTYRWSGSTFVVISETLALGTTSTTAYRGDRGAAAYTHAVTNKGAAFTSDLYKITTNSEGHVTAATAAAQSDFSSKFDIYPDCKVTITYTASPESYTSSLSASQIYTKHQQNYSIYGYLDNPASLLILKSSSSTKAEFYTIVKTTDSVYLDTFTIESGNTVTYARERLENTFPIEITFVGNTNSFTANKTYSEIISAKTDNKLIYISDSNGRISLTNIANNILYFNGVYWDSTNNRPVFMEYRIASDNTGLYVAKNQSSNEFIHVVDCTSSRPFVISDHEPGIYYFYDANQSKFVEPYFKWDSNTVAAKITGGIYQTIGALFVIVNTDIPTIPDEEDELIGFIIDPVTGTSGMIFAYYPADLTDTGYITITGNTYTTWNFARKSGNITETISNTYSFTKVPQCNANPTSNNQLARKAYVDTKQNKVLSGTTDPTSSQGSDGDIYIQYES